ncbi:MAG: hypothetical protein GTO03_06830 [Planctomycetales bacterium]|nr:hypothetical protein [Planctomycetales bacterium]
MGAILVWGSLLALGVLLFRRSLLGAGIALACTLGFLGVWRLLLRRVGGRPSVKGPVRRQGQGGQSTSDEQSPGGRVD